MWKQKDTDPQGNPHHYYASSVAQWKVGTDLVGLINHMKKDKYSFQVFRVGLPIGANYPIQFFAPVVDADALHYVGFWEYTK